MNTEDNQSDARVTPDLSELGELCGCTDKQIQFAEKLLQGASFTEAAYGIYAGERDSVQLRSAGSSAARAKPVQALLALAESRGLGVPNTPGDREELIRILWGHARSREKQSSIKASAELNRILDVERAAKDAEREHDTTSTLNEIAEILPLYAVHLAAKHKLEWQPSPEHAAAVEKARRELALAWIEEQKTKELTNG